MFKLSFYVPASHVAQVKAAVFAAGAGRIGAYDSCCWQVLGKGQFRPLEGSAPFIGQTGAVEVVDEYRVEMLCAQEFRHAVIAALLASHPYETPAWDMVSVVTELPPE
jgi:hypothetical protein